MTLYLPEMSSAASRLWFFSLHPVVAVVVCKRHQRIIFLLFQANAVLIKELIELRFKALQPLAKQPVRLLLGDAVGVLVFFAVAAVADGILLIVPVRLRGEALARLDELDACVRGAQLDRLVAV